MTVLELISDAFYLSGIVGREFQTVSPAQSSDGLRIFNQILSLQSTKGAYLPFYTEYTTPLVIGQESYQIPNLIIVDTVTFNQNDVRFSMREVGRDEFFGSFRVDNVLSLPAIYFVERYKGGSTINLYPKPDEAYVLKVHGRFGLTSVVYTDIIDDQVEENYISYLTYLLARRLCNYYQLPFSPDNQRVLDEYEEALFKISPSDLTVQKISTFGRPTSDYWAYANLYKGWWPS